MDYTRDRLCNIYGPDTVCRHGSLSSEAKIIMEKQQRRIFKILCHDGPKPLTEGTRWFYRLCSSTCDGYFTIARARIQDYVTKYMESHPGSAALPHNSELHNMVAILHFDPHGSGNDLYGQVWHEVKYRLKALNLAEVIAKERYKYPVYSPRAWNEEKWKNEIKDKGDRVPLLQFYGFCRRLILDRKLLRRPPMHNETRPVYEKALSYLAAVMTMSERWEGAFRRQPLFKSPAWPWSRKVFALIEERERKGEYYAKNMKDAEYEPLWGIVNPKSFRQQDDLEDHLWTTNMGQLMERLSEIHMDAPSTEVQRGSVVEEAELENLEELPGRWYFCWKTDTFRRRTYASIYRLSNDGTWVQGI